MTFVAVAKLKHLSTFFILQAKASVFLCVLVPWWLKEAPRNHHDTKNFTENVVQQPHSSNLFIRLVSGAVFVNLKHNARSNRIPLVGCRKVSVWLVGIRIS